MSGAQLAQARADMQQIATAGGFVVDINLTTPTDSLSVDVTGLGTGMFLNMDNEGNTVNASKFHISIPEKVLTDLTYPVRNGKGNVALIDHKVAVKDNTGTLRHYVINQCFPNSTLGLIVCILGKST